jgi:hypothetical protein
MTTRTLTLAFAFCLAACSDDPTPPTNKPDQGKEMGAPDLGQDTASDLSLDMMPDAAPDLDVPEMCVPRVQCSANACGMEEDGCGGMLDCGRCLCEDGMPTQPSCGVCGLGHIVCGEDARPPKCVQPELPDGITLRCDKLVFVDLAAQPGGDGSRERPLNDLLAGIEAGRERLSDVLVAGNTMVVLDTSLPVIETVSVIAGFESGTWRYDPVNNQPHVFGNNNAEGEGVGMIARGIISPTLIANMRIGVRDTRMPGQKSFYGAKILNSPGLILQRIVIQTLDGKAGDAGAPGDETLSAAGKRGSNGRPAQLASGGQGMPPQGGAGGTNTQCNAGGGGQGGRGGTFTAWSLLEPRPACDAQSGSPSSDGTPGGAPSCPGFFAIFNNNAPAFSRPAQSGAPGVATLTLEGESLVHGGLGGPGAQGADGKGGGGGGGASWCDDNFWTQATIRCSNNYHGASGGGGGAGGCGGQGGQGGQPGGNAIGMLAIGSSGLKLIDTVVSASAGGPGGQGGRGAAGGAGGEGGLGTDLAADGTTMPFRSGNGGKGADGQRGGDGGGGAGGFSVGIWCKDTIIIPRGQNSYTAAQGGAGAAPLTEGGVKAPDGESIATKDCGLE